MTNVASMQPLCPFPSWAITGCILLKQYNYRWSTFSVDYGNLDTNKILFKILKKKSCPVVIHMNDLNYSKRPVDKLFSSLADASSVYGCHPSACEALVIGKEPTPSVSGNIRWWKSQIWKIMFYLTGSSVTYKRREKGRQGNIYVALLKMEKVEVKIIYNKLN